MENKVDKSTMMEWLRLSYGAISPKDTSFDNIIIASSEEDKNNKLLIMLNQSQIYSLTK